MLWAATSLTPRPRRVFVCFAFVIGGDALLHVDWRGSASVHGRFVPDALVQAVRDRRPAKGWGWSITAKQDRNICVFATVNDRQRPGRSRQAVESEKARTTLCQRRSTVCLRLRLFAGARHGASSKRWATRQANGGLVQQLPLALPDREDPAPQSRNELLCRSGTSRRSPRNLQ